MMNKAERKLQAGKAIKALMQSHGARYVYQNLYKTGTRSIKMYRSSLTGPEHERKIKDQITDLADMFDLDVKFNITNRRVFSPPSFIAKL
jgi:GTP cyclohydrolase I